MKTFEEALELVTKDFAQKPTVEDLKGMVDKVESYGETMSEIGKDPKAWKMIEALYNAYGDSCESPDSMCEACCMKLLMACFCDGVLVGMEMEKKQ